MVSEECADQASVPRPVVLRVGRGVHSDEAVTTPDVTLESGLVLVVQHVSGCEHEGNNGVARQIGVGKRAGIFGCVDCEPVLHA